MSSNIFYKREILDLPPEAFMPNPKAGEMSDKIVRPSLHFWKDVWRRIKQNKVAMGGLIMIIVLSLMVAFVPLFTSYQYNVTDFGKANNFPSAEHWFGTDKLGRDLWSRVMIGGRVSLLVGFFGAIIPTIAGVIIGGISGYFGGVLDMLIMRIVDIIMCIPSLIYTIMIMLYMGTGPIPIIFALAITGWVGTCRSVRGLVLQLKVREFVLASRAVGSSAMKIIWKHLIPNTMGIVVVGVTMRIPAAIFQEAFLSFIGLGIQSPMTSWGQLAQVGGEVYRSFPYQLIFPSIFICLTMLSFNLFGDGLRDALDPRMRT